ncbi:MAG: SIMPL domain-containing protein [Anaerolineaceae bacterium]
MKKSVIALAAIMVLTTVLSACTTAALPAAAAPTLRTINVSGQGLTYITPDVAYVYIGVHSQSESVADALKDNNSQATAVTEALKEMGVDAKDIQTTNFNVYPMQTYGQQGEVTGTTYSVDNTVYVTVRKLDQLGKLLDTVVKSGANSINGVTFDVVEKEEALAAARKLAIENARKQAEEIASVTGVTLGDLVSININAANPPSMYEMKGLGGGGGMASSVMAPISAGQMVITADAYLSYEIK